MRRRKTKKLQKGSSRQSPQALLQKGRLEEARRLFEERCRGNPGDAEAHYMVGSIFGRQGKYLEAIPFLERTIRLKPDVAVSHAALAAAFKAVGRLSDAENSFRRVLQMQPGFAEARIELAAILLARGGTDHAAEELKRVLKDSPRSDDALHLLGDVHQACHRFDEAITCYSRALEINPKRVLSHYRMGIALHAMGVPDRAVKHLKQTVKLQPDFTEAYKFLGISLTKLGRREEARSAYEKALSLQPDSIDLQVCEADLMEQEGKFEAAMARIGPLLTCRTPHVGAGLVFAHLCRHFQRCPEAIEYLESLLDKPELTESSREEIHFSLGKLYDADGDYDSAFAHFRKANEIRPNRFDPERHAATFSMLEEMFSSEFLAHAPRATIRTERPLFIVGMPRSGTSLVEQILASHPAVFGAGELVAMGNIVGELAAGRYGRSGYPGCFQGLNRKVVESLAKKYLDGLEKLAPAAERVTDKMPQNFQHLGLIALLLPGARVIHCTRDPRDTCLSIYSQHFFENISFANDLGHLGLYYRQYVRLMHHWKQVLDLPILEVPYEGLVEDQEGWSRRLIEFAGLPWDERCLHFYRTRRTVATSSYDQVRRPIYKSSVGRWRHYGEYLSPLYDALGLKDPGDG